MPAAAGCLRAGPESLGRAGWTTVHLDAIDLAGLQDALEPAWRHAQPRGRRAQQRETTG
jgi:hypothetical protein